MRLCIRCIKQALSVGGKLKSWDHPEVQCERVFNIFWNDRCPYRAVATVDVMFPEDPVVAD